MGLKKGVDIKPATGKLGILMPGMGAVATTFIAGVMAVRKNLAKPIGSLTQMGRIRLGKRTEGNSPLIKDYIPLAGLGDIAFGGWDIFNDNAYQAAVRAGVLDTRLLDQIKSELEAIKPMSAVFEQQWVKRLDGPNVKKGTSKRDLVNQLMADIADFKKTNNCDRLVAVWCGSTEVYRKPGDVHSTLAKFEAGLDSSNDEIAPSQMYAYACLKSGVPYACRSPNPRCRSCHWLRCLAPTGRARSAGIWCNCCPRPRTRSSASSPSTSATYRRWRRCLTVAARPARTSSRRCSQVFPTPSWPTAR